MDEKAEQGPDATTSVQTTDDGARLDEIDAARRAAVQEPTQGWISEADDREISDLREELTVASEGVDPSKAQMVAHLRAATRDLNRAAEALALALAALDGQ